MTGGAGRDDWNDDDHYPMHPSHPGWNRRPAGTERLRRVVMVLFPVLVAATGLAMAWQWWRS